MIEPTTSVVLLPSGNIAYRMDIWWRELGPGGQDWGNFFTLPAGAVPLCCKPVRDSLWRCFQIPNGAGTWFRLTPWSYLLLVIERIRLRRSERRYARQVAE